MSHIPIKNINDENGTVIYFPVPKDGYLTIDDLRSAFPNAVSLRYKDANNDKQHHILCRENTFIEPNGGWHKTDRLYFAVSNTTSQNSNRFGLFDSYRKQLSTRQKQASSKRTEKSEEQESASAMIGVGHGQFKNGIFSKISTTSLSGCGGIVQVGPFLKTGNTSSEIKKAAFDKFTQQNRAFRQKYKRNDMLHLVYPDGSLVDKLPGSSEEFSLLEYRNGIDPHKRFDRLRLYLCSKSNYDLNQPFEIISESSSSSDELPDLYGPSNGTKDTHCSTSSHNDNDSLPLIIKVVFHHQTDRYVENFPNNVKGSVLLGYIQIKMNVQESAITMKIKNSNTVINADDRMMDIMTGYPIEVEVEMHESEQQDGNNDTVHDEPIRASYFCDEDCNIADTIVDRTISIMNGTSEPCAILKKYQTLFHQGRPLDVIEETSTIDGDTTCLYVSRSSVFQDSMEEIKFAENIRFPVEANFHGENAEDLGGPRREFFELFFKQFKEQMLTEIDDKLVLALNNEESIARHRYYYAGLFLGLSVLQGGPMPEFLTSVLSHSNESEEKKQLVKGLQRTGLMQLVEKKTTLRFLFMPSESSVLNVNKFLHTFQAEFSEEGTSRRVLEENSYRTFIRYLREVYAGRRDNITIEAILRFCTCSSNIPVLGFTMRPSIHFSEGLFPTAITCINRLILPLGDLDFDRLDMAFMNEYFGRE